jgi:predicted DsbA family dithiol-disulfide isomerase
MPQQSQNIPGPAAHKGKKAMRIIYVSILVFFFGFALLFSYYLWIEKYGDPDARETLRERFDEGFSLLPGASSRSGSAIDIDPQELIRAHNPQFGPIDAPITVIAFIDFECPFCRAAYSEFEQMRDRFGGAVRIVFKHFPLHTIHPQALDASLAAQCAHDQGAFWPFYKELFEKKRLSHAALQSYAESVGMQTDHFLACLGNQQHANTVIADIEDGLRVDVRGTPTYIIGNQKIEGVTHAEEWEALILESLRIQNE